MATGLRIAGEATTIANTMHQQLGPGPNGPNLSFTQLATAIYGTVSARLAHYNVPAPGLSVQPGPKGGRFEFDNWRLVIFDYTQPPGAPPALNNWYGWMQVVCELGDTISHESRHSEQWFRMARLIKTNLSERGLHPSAEAIQAKMTIPVQGGLSFSAHAAGLAILLADLPNGSAERDEAQTWYDSVYGRWGEQRMQTLGMLSHPLRPVGVAGPTAGQTVLADLQMAGSQATSRLFANYSRELPEEDDAWAMGHSVQAAFLGPLGLQPFPLRGHAPVRQGV
jgi:hypothetical protein